jgi:hypothetical protein
MAITTPSFGVAGGKPGGRRELHAPVLGKVRPLAQVPVRDLDDLVRHLVALTEHLRDPRDGVVRTRPGTIPVVVAEFPARGIPGKDQLTAAVPVELVERRCQIGEEGVLPRLLRLLRAR